MTGWEQFCEAVQWLVLLALVAAVFRGGDRR